MKKIALFALAVAAVGANAQTFAGGGMTLPPVGTGGSLNSDSTTSSSATVSGVGTGALDISVLVNGLTHTWPDDLDFVLVSPTGKGLILMSDAGGSTDVSGLSVGFSDSGSGPAPDSTVLGSGPYTASNYGTGDTWYTTGTTLLSFTEVSNFAGFLGDNADGSWTLWVRDDAGGDIGSISDWSITFTTVPEPTTMALFGLGAAAIAARRRRSK